MKRRIITIIMIGMLSITLTGCGDNETNQVEKSYILFSNDEKISFSELNKSELENTYAFKEKYCGSDFDRKPKEIVAKLESIDEEKTVDYGSENIDFLVITVSEKNFKIEVELRKNKFASVISEMKVGDYLKFTNIGSLTCNGCGTNSCMHKIYNPDVEIIK